MKASSHATLSELTSAPVRLSLNWSAKDKMGGAYHGEES
jgi:hypothetical protein